MFAVAAAAGWKVQIRIGGERRDDQREAEEYEQKNGREAPQSRSYSKLVETGNLVLEGVFAPGKRRLKAGGSQDWLPHSKAV
jgi:hypothetical protein